MKLFHSAIQLEEVGVTVFQSTAPGNLFRVENTPGGGAIICAARNNFDPAQRRTLVRYLQTEGFISKDGHLMAAGSGGASALPAEGQVWWVCDPCWPYAAVRFNPYSRRLCWRLLLGTTLAWLLLMWLAAFR